MIYDLSKADIMVHKKSISFTNYYLNRMGFLEKIFNPKQPASKTIIAMVVLADETSFSYRKFLGHFQDNYQYLSNASGDDIAATFEVDGESVALMNIDKPIPWDDIERTAQYSYNWPKALEDLKDHKSHVIIALTEGSTDVIKRFNIHTKLICSALRKANSIGVYLGQQSLLITKDSYLNLATFMSDSALPLYLWVYFGYRTINEKRSAYSYGLKAFGKPEIEIVDSDRAFTDLEEMIYNVAHYVVLNDVDFKDGQTFGYTADQKLKLTYSNGRFVSGKSFKLSY